MDIGQPRAPSLEDFLSSIAKFSTQFKFYKWEDYLKTLKAQNDCPNYQSTLEKFLQSYPFNHKQWGQIVQLALKAPKSGKSTAVRLYQMALAQNPHSITLWKNYLQWLQRQICRSDPSYLQKQYDKAIKIIGNHYKAGFIFQATFHLQSSPPQKYLILKKALVSPIQDLDLIYDLAANWIDDPSSLSFNGLVAVAQQEQLKAQNQSELRQTLKSQLRRLYEPSKRHVQQRQEWQVKLGDLDQYSPSSGKIQTWRGYISWIKGSGNPQLVAPLYQRALITNCDSQALWEQYFLLLENESNYAKALYILRSHSHFFRGLSRELTYYWLQLQERQSHIRSREIYLQLQKTQPNLQVFLRHIQMEVRYKEFLHARILYQTLLTTFTANPDILAPLLQQYSELALKYFRDVDVRKLLRSYFDAYPFHQGLFLTLLRFYRQHVQVKENTKQSKAILDLFTEIVVEGLRRAYQAVPDQYPHLSKVVRKVMRDYLGNIFAVKTAQRKIKEMEMHERKRERADKVEGLKRDRGQFLEQERI